MELEFTPRSNLHAVEWDAENKHWERPELDREVLKELTRRSTFNGLWRVGLFSLLLGLTAAATVWVSQRSILLAIPVLYCYYFLYGFWVAIAHELQHKMVFARTADRFSEMLFFVVQVLLWNSPRYARVSHRLHHRFTMVRGVDPETDWPETFTSHWLRRYLFGYVLRILVVGAIYQLGRDALTQARRALGQKDRMMREHCTTADITVIRLESLAILLFHVVLVMLAVWFRRWEPIVFVTIAWQIGSGIEMLWHQTEHIGRLYNVNDQRLCTRSIRVGPFIHLLYWGLDDHVDHHIFPGVPSGNLPKLHRLLKDYLPAPKSIIGCWTEMFAIARRKDDDPTSEYVPCRVVGIGQEDDSRRLRRP